MRRKSVLSVTLTAVMIGVILLSGSLSVRAGALGAYSCPVVSCVRKVYTQEWHEPQKNTAVQDTSDYAISDMAALTVEDGNSSEQNPQQPSRFQMKSAATAGTDAFALFRQTRRSGNDDWIFLVCGIGLIAAAIVIFIVTICTSRRTKKKSRKGK